jgi:hypothetical protein
VAWHEKSKASEAKSITALAKAKAAKRNCQQRQRRNGNQRHIEIAAAKRGGNWRKCDAGSGMTAAASAAAAAGGWRRNEASAK